MASALLACPRATLVVGGQEGLLVRRGLVVRRIRRGCHQARKAADVRRSGSAGPVGVGGGTSGGHGGGSRGEGLRPSHAHVVHPVGRRRSEGRTDGEEQRDEREHDPESLHPASP